MDTYKGGKIGRIENGKIIGGLPKTRTILKGSPECSFQNYITLIKRLVPEGSGENWGKWKGKPHEFCRKWFRESYTDDVKRMMESVANNEVTVAISCNASGKTHSAARLAVWFYKCYEESRVYTAAAPPEDNLRKLLWGEMGKLTSRFPRVFDEDVVTGLNIERNKHSFITGVTIPSTGTDADKEAKFCTDADDFFEQMDGSLVLYKDLIGKKINVISFDKNFNKEIEPAEFFDNGEKEIYEVELMSGVKMRRTGEHPFYCGEIAQDFHTHGGLHVKGRSRVSKEGWKNVKDIKAGDAILIPEDTSFNFGHEEINENEIKVIAYLIGDGYIKTKKIQFIKSSGMQMDEFTSCAKSIGANVSEYNREYFSKTVTGNRRKNGNPIAVLLKKYGLYGKDSSNKHVPVDFFRLNKKQLALFLNRLFSTDGYCCLCKCKDNYKKVEIGYTSKSGRLVKEIQILLFRYGIESLVRECRKSWSYKGVKKWGNYFTLTICRSKDVLLFSKEIGIFSKEEDIKRCEKYSHARNKNCTWRDGNILGFRWDKIKTVSMVGKRPTVGVYVHNNHTYLTGAAEHNSGKHAPNMMFIFDEGDAIPDAVYRGTESCVSGGLTRTLIMFNPRHESGYVYRLIRDGKANVVHLSAFGHPNVIEGRDIFPGAVTREKTVKRINEWTRELHPEEKVDDECFEVPEFLVGSAAEKSKDVLYPPLNGGFRKIMDSQFAYMVLGRYPAQSEFQLISKAWIRAARDRWDKWVSMNGEIPPVNSECIMGQDVAEFGKDWNSLCFRWGYYVERFRKWNGVDTLVSGDISIREYEQRKPRTKRCNVDATGVGAGIAPWMVRNRCVAGSVMVGSSPDVGGEEEEVFNLTRDQLLWRMREWLRTDEKSMLPPGDSLEDELKAYTYERKNGKIYVMPRDKIKKLIGHSPDESSSLALTFYEPSAIVDDWDLS